MKSAEEFAEVFHVDRTKPKLVPTEEQWAAITAPLEPCIIVAGAGTGKTTTMASRISYLIATGAVAPEKILGLTFTKKAARELAKAVRERSAAAMSHRLANYPTDNSEALELGEPTISTYNSFGARLLKEHGLRIGIEPEARLLVDATRHQLAKRVVARTKVLLADLGFTSLTVLVKAVLSLDKDCSDYLVDPEEVITYDTNLLARFSQVAEPTEEVEKISSAAKRRIAVAQIVQEFRAAKLAEGFIDYSDQIRLAADTVFASSEVRDIYRSQYEVVLLDEYQDTSVSQKVLLERLFGAGHPVMAVGDPCQAIYGWRGADVANIENFATDFPNLDGTAAKTYELSVNRRSSQLILDAANSLSDPLRAIHTRIVKLVAGDVNMPPGEIHTAILESHPEEITWTCDQIEAQIKNGVEPRDIAILLRASKFGAGFVAELEKRGIPVQVANAEVLVHLPEVRDVLCYLELMVNPTANTELVRLLAGPKWRIGARDLALLGREAKQIVDSDYQAEKDLPMHLQLQHAVGSTDAADQVCLLDALEVVANSKLPYSDEARARMSEFASQLRELRRHSGDSAIDAITRIIRETGIAVEALARPSTISKTPSDHLGSLIDLAGAFRSLDDESDIYSFLRFLADGAQFKNLPFADLPITGNSVVIMTVHSSKGLEFPVVAVPLFSKDQFPSRGDGKHWMTNPDILPYALKNPKIDEARILTLLLAENPDEEAISVYKEFFKDLGLMDETRLAYVAATRAKRVLISSGSYWGTPNHKTKWGPTEFIQTISKHATTFKNDATAPVKGDKNPNLKTSDFPVWPAEVVQEKFTELQRQANLVRNASEESVGQMLTQDESKFVQELDADISALFELLATTHETTRKIKLPDTLTASQLISLTTDESAFVQNLVRPMPRKPAPEAIRGTEFHAWVEDFYGLRIQANLEEELPGTEMPVTGDLLLDSLKQSFKSGQFASRRPEELEFPFSIIVSGRPIIGRIDAIFSGSATDPTDNKWTVIDWKTGAPGSANSLQLHVYRAAWAQHKGVPLEQVDAGFYYVGYDQVELVSEVMTIEQLSGLLEGSH